MATAQLAGINVSSSKMTAGLSEDGHLPAVTVVPPGKSPEPSPEADVPPPERAITDESGDGATSPSGGSSDGEGDRSMGGQGNGVGGEEEEEDDGDDDGNYDVHEGGMNNGEGKGERYQNHHGGGAENGESSDGSSSDDGSTSGAVQQHHNGALPSAPRAAVAPGRADRSSSPVRVVINVNDVPRDAPPGSEIAAVEAATAASQPVRARAPAAAGRPDANGWAAAVPRTSSSPPPPTTPPAHVQPCLRGKMVAKPGGGWMVEGLWGMSKEAHQPGMPEGSTSPFVMFCAPPQPPPPYPPMDAEVAAATEAAAAAAVSDMATFPYSGAYQSRFTLYQGPHKPSAQIPEKDLHVAFERNSVGSWNVEGTGHNKFGAYTLSGLLEADGALEVYKVYLPKGQGIPRSPRGSSSSAIGGGGGLKRGRSDGVAAALARGSSSGGKGGGKQLARAVGGGALSTNNDYGTSAAGDDDGWGPAGGPLSADGMGPSPPGHARRVSRTPSHLVESDPLSEPLRKCMRVLQALMNVKGKSHWFTSPVDVVALRIPDYNRIIKTPMDLGTIKSKLENGAYGDPEEFANDVRLVFRNAVTYNVDRTSFVNVAARELEAMFEERFASIKPTFDDFEHGPLKRKKSGGGPGAFGGSAYGSFGGGGLEPAKRKSNGGSSKRLRSSPGGPRSTANLLGGADGFGNQTVALPLSQLAMMQQQYDDLRRQLEEVKSQQRLQRVGSVGGGGGIGGGGGGIGGGGGTGGSGRLSRAVVPPAAVVVEAPPPEPEAPQEPLTFDEKRQLSDDINKLTPDKLTRVVQIIQERMPLGSRGEEEIEIDIDSMDTPTLRDLQRYVGDCLAPKRSSSKKRTSSKSRGAYANAAYDSDSDDDADW